MFKPIATLIARRNQAGFTLMDLTMAVACVLFLSTLGVFAYNEIAATVQTDLFQTTAEETYTTASAVSLEKESPRSSCATHGSTSQTDCGRF